jgi:asparagine synthase (glutamine-hydrolysing)
MTRSLGMAGVVDFSTGVTNNLRPSKQCSTWGGAGRLRLTADIQLHNRSELANALAIGQGNAIPGDDELALAAFSKWGTKCPEFLLGEFAFAIWDEDRKVLFCCRDHMGARPFVYCLSRTGIVFGTQLREILENPVTAKEPNLRKIAALALRGGLGQYPEETFHKSIYSLPPGSWMTIDQAGVKRHTYWSPGIRESLVPTGDAQVFEALSELLQRAVACRLDRSLSPAAHLSGGLDSSAVVGLAARHLSAQGRTLTAVSAVLGEDSRTYLSDERDFIDEFRGVPGVRTIYVSAPGRGPFDDIHDPKCFEPTFLLYSRYYLSHALEQAALEQGADVLLEGSGGEFGPTCSGDPYYAQLACHGRWPTLIRELRALERVRGISPVRALASQLVNSARPLRRFQPLVFLKDEFVRNAGVEETRPRLKWPDQRRRQKTMIQGFLRKHALRAVLPERPLRISDPYLDKRVVEFCLAAPAQFKVRDGYQRYLMRKSMEGILPPRIQWRTTKTAFSPDYFIRYNAQLKTATRFAGEVSARDPVRSVVDVDKLTGMLQTADILRGNPQMLNGVPQTIYLIQFLRQFPEFRP